MTLDASNAAAAALDALRHGNRVRVNHSRADELPAVKVWPRGNRRRFVIKGMCLDIRDGIDSYDDWVAANERIPDKWKVQGMLRLWYDAQSLVYGYKQIVYDRQLGQCAYGKSALPTNYELDHVVPLKLNGKHDLTNLVGACRSCNRRKSHRADWRDMNFKC